jgi:hypothetical protein
MSRDARSLKCEDVMANVKRAICAQRLEVAGIPIHLQDELQLALTPGGIIAFSPQYPGVRSDG